MSAIVDVLPLAGEGEQKVVVKTRYRHECENCGEPATKRHSYCYVNGRRNPASSMYGRDDCTYCSDAERFSCDECARTIERDAPEGMNWGGTFSAGGRFDHMLLYWHERPANEAELAAIAKATGEAP